MRVVRPHVVQVAGAAECAGEPHANVVQRPAREEDERRAERGGDAIERQRDAREGVKVCLAHARRPRDCQRSPRHNLARPRHCHRAKGDAHSDLCIHATRLGEPSQQLPLVRSGRPALPLVCSARPALRQRVSRSAPPPPLRNPQAVEEADLQRQTCDHHNQDHRCSEVNLCRRIRVGKVGEEPPLRVGGGHGAHTPRTCDRSGQDLKFGRAQRELPAEGKGKQGAWYSQFPYPQLQGSHLNLSQTSAQRQRTYFL